MKRILSALLVAMMLLSLCGCKSDPAITTTPTDVITGIYSPTGPLYDRASYTAADDVAIAAHDQVVATVGASQITNAMVQFAYWSDYFTFLDLNAYYATMLGLDYTQPLDTQLMSNSTVTWQQYFLRETMNDLHNDMALYLAALDADTELPDELVAELEDLENALEKAAQENEFDTGLDYLLSRHGPGTTAEDFIQYMTMVYIGSYYYSLKLAQVNVTEQMIQDYYNTNETELNQSGVVKDGSVVYHIRHIMLSVAEDATEADWEAREKDIQALLDQWLAGDRTEESFAALATEHSQDEGSSFDGGLYKGATHESTFDQAFMDWYLEDGRKTGDYGIVRTEFGYHIIYFVDKEETWHYQCGNAVYNVTVENIMEETAAQYPITVDYSKIQLAIAPSSIISYD